MKQDRAVNFRTQAPTEKDLLTAVDQLAQMIRENLALSPQIVNELKAQSFKPSSKSLDAIRLYSEGIDLAGKRQQSRSSEAFSGVHKSRSRICSRLRKARADVRKFGSRQRSRAVLAQGRRFI